MSRKKSISKVRLVATLGDHILTLEKQDGTFSLPGGRVKTKETGLKALIREVKEEVGLILDKKDLKYLGTEIKSKSDCTIHKSYYSYHQKVGTAKNLESEKFKAVKWCLWFEVSDYLDKQDRKAILSFFSKKQLVN